MTKMSNYDDSPIVPTYFKNSWYHPLPTERAKWREAIEYELESMKQKNVWKLVNRNEIPEYKHAIPMKWVYNIKTDERYRARLVVLGFRQV